MRAERLLKGSWLIAATSVAVICAGFSQAPALAAVPTGNLVVNPGAETGSAGPTETTVQTIPGWSTTSGFTVVEYDTGTLPGSPTGFPTTAVSQSIGGQNNFFAGGDSATATATQTINVSGAATEIDAGAVSATLGADIGGYQDQEDNGVVAVSYLSGSGAALGSLTIGPVSAADRSNQTTLLPKSAAGHVPAGTRSITVTLTASRVTGTSNDGYFDNIGLVLSGGGGGGGGGGGAAKRPSATHVTCDYTFADDTDVCTAIVVDAFWRSGQPTGTVTFNSTIAGTTFSNGASCALTQQEGDVGVSSCSVTYEGTQTRSLQTTAAYHGDAAFQPSNGSTQFLLAGQGANAYGPTIGKFNPPTLNTTVNVPPGGGTVSTSGDVTSDLTSDAVCQADPDQSDNTDSLRSGIEAFSARAKSRPRSVRVRVVRRYKHAGKVRVALHFNTRALARAFPRTTRVQVVVGVTIRSRRGGQVSLFRRKVLTLHRHHKARKAAVAVAAAATVSHTWHGSDSCDSLDVTVAPSLQVTVTWNALLRARGFGTVPALLYGLTLSATTTATVVGPGVYSFTVDSSQAGADFQISGQVRIGAAGTSGGSGTASGRADFEDPLTPSHPYSGNPPSGLVQTS